MADYDLSDTPEESQTDTNSSGGGGFTYWWRPSRNDEEQVGGVVMGGRMVSGYEYEEVQGDETDVPVVTIAVAEGFTDPFSTQDDEGREIEASPEAGMAVNLPTHARLLNELENVSVGDAVVVECGGYHLPDGADNAQYLYTFSQMSPEQYAGQDFEDTLNEAQAAYSGETGDDRVFYDENGNPKGQPSQGGEAATDGGMQAAKPAGKSADSGMGGGGPDTVEDDLSGFTQDEADEGPDVPEGVREAAWTYVKQISDDMECTVDELDHFLKQTVGSEHDTETVIEVADVHLWNEDEKVHARPEGEDE